ncbi:MAG: transketolase C-terminal domain-containing protein [Balneolaceae bacterium]|nr:transketolase C-terminal domain-containing protein [Balneolaceae bacterium]
MELTQRSSLYGLGVHWAHEVAKNYVSNGTKLEIVDLRCLQPLDFDTVQQSVAKTNKVLLLQEPSMTLGPMSEISSLISERCFKHLDAPIMRCSSLDMPIPYNKNLEKGYLANSRLEENY